jgi:putative ABC transport system ATP-binding protein
MYLMTRLSLPLSIADQASHQLSVGQQQRVAAARAFIGNPQIVIADEPSSALDWENQSQFMQLFLELGESQKTTLLLVSHDERLAPFFNQRIDLPKRGFDQ